MSSTQKTVRTVVRLVAGSGLYPEPKRLEYLTVIDVIKKNVIPYKCFGPGYNPTVQR
ncbi:MAG: hypothetical protein WCT49_02130 [Candidatus Paceibacterota bacterium]